MGIEGVSDAMQEEETRMRAQREKFDAKRDAQLEEERQADLKSGREVLDKKFQQLEFLMNKSKVRIKSERRVSGIRVQYSRHTWKTC
jgi:ATP-dependent DNA helicase